MSFCLYLSVKSSYNLNLTQHRHRIISDIQDEPFFCTHISLFLSIDLSIKITDFPLNHLIKEDIDTLDIPIKV